MIEFKTTQDNNVWLNPLDVTSIEESHTGSVVTMNNGTKFYLVLQPKVIADQVHAAFDDMDGDESGPLSSN